MKLTTGLGSIVRDLPSKQRILAVVITMLLLGLATQAQRPQENPNTAFISFDFPGAVNTQATAITPTGQIVGRYITSDGVQHGFLLNNGKFKSIDIPNSTFTDVAWMNPTGAMVGTYTLSDGISHGFVLSAGGFTSFDYPGASATLGFGISPTGDVVGIEFDSDGSLHGYLLTHGRFSRLDFPGANATLPTMIIGGLIIGGYDDASGSHGFKYENGKVETVDCPGSRNVFLSGLNQFGDVTGEVTGMDGIQHGLLVIGKSCITVDFPASQAGSNYANGIDPSENIVGRYSTPDGVVHAYFRKKH